MGNITTLPQHGGAYQNVIERLEETLDMAKKGNIANLMIVMVDAENRVMHGWANGNRPTHLIQQPLNDAQMLAAWLLSIKGAHNWDCTGRNCNGAPRA